MSNDTEKALRYLGVEPRVLCGAIVFEEIECERRTDNKYPCQQRESQETCELRTVAYPTGTAAVEAIKEKLREKGIEYSTSWSEKNGANCEHRTQIEDEAGRYGATEEAAFVAAVLAMKEA